MTDIRLAERAGSGPAPPNPLAATGLAASLTVSDLASSAAWYRDVLGFRVEREFERGGVTFAVRLTAGSVELLLTQDTGAKGADRVKGEGFSLRVTTTDSVDELAARIKARGVALDSEPLDFQGARVFRLRDPDGFRLAISSQR